MHQLPLYLSLMLLTGCSTSIRAPGALGMIVDAETGKPIRGAQVIRPAVTRSWNVPQGLPEVRVKTGRFGRFHVPVERESEFFNTTPAAFTPTFTVVADGYVTTNITLTASSNTHWRVDLGRVKLTRQ